MTITLNFETKLQSLFFEKIYGGNLTTLTLQMASLLEHKQATVAINDLLCMKNAGAQIAMDFS